MLKIKKDLDRTSGGKIPAGAMLDYDMTVSGNSDALDINWRIFYNEDAMKVDKIPVPPQDIKAFQMKGDQQIKSISGVRYTPDPELIKKIKNPTLRLISDTIVKTMMEERFLGEGSCEIV